jgi:hypothetical protein
MQWNRLYPVCVDDLDIGFGEATCEFEYFEIRCDKRKELHKSRDRLTDAIIELARSKK